MPINFSDTLVVGISSRTLFNLEAEEGLFQNEGIDAYRKTQKAKENDVLEPGTAFYLVKALLNLNKLSTTQRLVEVIVMSRNSPETGVRVLNSIKALKLDITRSAFTGGEAIAPYMEAFGVDLFLSKNEEDVQSVIDSKTAAAAIILDPPENMNSDTSTVRIAFDADAVLFSEESELIYKTQGLEAFAKNEEKNAQVPLKEGPHAKFLRTLSKIQSYMTEAGDIESTPIRIAIVTANSPSHACNRLYAIDVYVDEAFRGISRIFLKAFNAHIFLTIKMYIYKMQARWLSGKVLIPGNR